MDVRNRDAALVLRNLRQLVHGLRMTAHSVERDLGLSGAQLFVLRELAAEPGISIRRVSERTLTDPSSVSVVVARLLKQELILRSQDPLDKRRSVLAVSEKGLALLKRAPEPYQARLFEALQTLPRTQLRQLQTGLSALIEATSHSSGAVPLFFEGTPTVNKTGKSNRGSSSRSPSSRKKRPSR